MKQLMTALIDRKTVSRRAATSATEGWLGKYWADEAGNMSYVAVAGALVMMVFGGIGIDMIHAELKRNKVQNTLDRAVIAAANVENEMDPATTVNEYFSAMGMSDALSSVSVEQGPGNRSVTATGGVTMPSNLLSLIGVDTLQAEGLATAVNGLGNIEISLVLDVSGSMGGNKIEQLRTAAKSFVDTMIPPEAGVEGSLVTISLIPYNATVNIGPELAAYYNLDDGHNYSHCATFDAADYGSTSISTTQQLTRIAHFDPYGGSGTEVTRPWCPTGNTSAILPHSSDPAALKAHIDTLTAGGNTAIDLGVKWGAALLDPATQPVMNQMIASGAMAAPASPRPAAFDDNETMKFVVVMTDGQNTSQYDLKPERKYGLSNTWVDDHGTPGTGDDRYSIKVVDLPGDSHDVYLWTHHMHLSAWERYRLEPFSWAVHGNENSPSSPRQMTNAELYASMKTRAYGNTYYWDAYRNGHVTYNDYVEAYYAYEVIVDGNQADSQLSTVCQTARNSGIVVYAIGVEAPERGLAAMSDCASSPAHYFDVSGSELNETFSSIARSLQTLRLTQ